MNYLFWNVNKKKLNEKIKEAIIEYTCDVIILAEYEGNIDDLIKSLHNEGYNFYSLKQIGCNKIHIVTKFIPQKIKRLTDGNRYTIDAVPHNRLTEINIAPVHLSSKLNSGNDTRLREIRIVKSKLEEVEKKYKGV